MGRYLDLAQKALATGGAIPVDTGRSSESLPEARSSGGLPKPTERWTIADEAGCRRCRRCQGRIVWGQIDHDTEDPKAKGRWVKLDPDLMPHGCGTPGAGRVVIQSATEGDATSHQTIAKLDDTPSIPENHE